MQNLDSLKPTDPRLPAFNRCVAASLTVATLTPGLPLWLLARRLYRRVTQPEWPGYRLHLSGWQRRTISTWLLPTCLAAFAGAAAWSFDRLRRRCRVDYYGVASLDEADAAHAAWLAERSLELRDQSVLMRRFLHDKRREGLAQLHLVTPADDQEGDEAA